MLRFAFFLLFLVPAAVLCWRLVVTRSRSVALRAGAAAAAMITIVGAFVVHSEITVFDFADWRSDLALAAAVSGSLYLLGWALKHNGNRRHRTISILAAILGFVPLAGALASNLMYRE
jgi:hypothetical protein